MEKMHCQPDYHSWFTDDVEKVRRILAADESNRAFWIDGVKEVKKVTAEFNVEWKE